MRYRLLRKVGLGTRLPAHAPPDAHRARMPGPDSAGIALWGQGDGDDLLVRVKVGDGDLGLAGARSSVARSRSRACRRPALRARCCVSRWPGGAGELAAATVAPDVGWSAWGSASVVAVGAPAGSTPTSRCPRGRHPQARSPACRREPGGSRAPAVLGHGTPISLVHNGHICLHRLRRIYEQEGVRFYTEATPRSSGSLWRRSPSAGRSARRSRHRCATSTGACYLVGTADAFGFAKDPFSLKPLIVARLTPSPSPTRRSRSRRARLPVPGARGGSRATLELGRQPGRAVPRACDEPPDVKTVDCATMSAARRMSRSGS